MEYTFGIWKDNRLMKFQFSVLAKFDVRTENGILKKIARIKENGGKSDFFDIGVDFILILINLRAIFAI